MTTFASAFSSTLTLMVMAITLFLALPVSSNKTDTPNQAEFDETLMELIEGIQKRITEDLQFIERLSKDLDEALQPILKEELLIPFSNGSLSGFFMRTKGDDGKMKNFLFGENGIYNYVSSSEGTIITYEGDSKILQEGATMLALNIFGIESLHEYNVTHETCDGTSSTCDGISFTMLTLKDQGNQAVTPTLSHSGADTFPPYEARTPSEED